MNIQVTLNNSGSHPVYNFQLLSRDGKHRVEKSLRFAPCREFHEDIVSSCDVVLEAPFPVTMKRSALGIKLTDDELEERRRQLAKYMLEIVERFSEWPKSMQDGFINLVSAESIPLEYFWNRNYVQSTDSDPIQDLTTSALREQMTSKEKKAGGVTAQQKKDIDAIRLEELQTSLDIKITLDNTGDHPTYKMQLKSKDNVYNVEQTMRFASYRDFQQNVMDKCNIKILAEFPDTKKRSSLGIKLTDEELIERSTKLHQYMNEVLRRYEDLPVDTQMALIAFLKADYVPLLYFKNPRELSEELEKDKDQSNKQKKSLSKKLLSQMSSIGTQKDVETDKHEGPMEIIVSRNESNNKIKYDVLIRVNESDKKQITVCSRPFKDFRQLKNDISSDLEKVENGHDIEIPDFPITYTRSSFGISLDESAVIDRVRGLDEWLRIVVKTFPLLSNRSQLFIKHFLNLDCLVNNEQYEDRIQAKLIAGNVTSAGELNNIMTGQPTGRKYVTIGQGSGATIDVPEDEWLVIGQNETPDANKPKGCCTVS